MKKLLGIVVLGLLLSGNVLADILSTAEQKKLISNGTIKKGMTLFCQRIFRINYFTKCLVSGYC